MKFDFFLGARDTRVENEAKALGFDRVYFIKEVSAVADIKKDGDYDGILIKTNAVEIMRRVIDKASNFCKIILVLGVNDSINRAALEHKKTYGLVSPEFERDFDYTHYRNSGLNQVLCKIARDNGKKVMINFEDLLMKDKKERAILFGRIIQNIGLCRKYKASLKIGNFSSGAHEMRSASELGAFCRAIGMTPAESNNSLS